MTHVFIRDLGIKEMSKRMAYSETHEISENSENAETPTQ